MRRGLAIVLAALVAGSAAAGCGSGSSTAADPAGGESGSTIVVDSTIVVTYSVLGSLVTDLVGDQADVTVLMPNGVDPHDWQPSAKDVETLGEADLVVTNGLGLEESLDEALAQAQGEGVPVFVATDDVEVRTIGEGEVAEEHHEAEEHAEEESHAEGEDEHAEEHGVGAQDPHIWTDPVAMERVVAALATTLADDLGLDIADRAADLEARLQALDAELEQTLSSIPAGERKLVTGHESMGYFADRYGFQLVGAVIPSISSQAEASAGELAELAEQIEEQGVSVIFTEIGTPDHVADAIAEETGAEVVALPSHNLPDDGSYFTFMRDIASEIAGALGP